MTTRTVETQPLAGTYQPRYKLIAEKIIELIVTTGLRPGERLPTEQALATQMGVSRGVVREAIKSLMAVGVVGARRGAGLYVTTLPEKGLQPGDGPAIVVDPDTIGALFAFRGEQEMLTARLAAEHLTVAELRELEHIVARNREYADTNQREPFLTSDVAFHLAIAQATHNPFFLATIKNILQLQSWALRLALGRAPGSLLVSAEQHEAIFRALKHGESAEAAQAAKIHVETVLAAYRQEATRLLLGGNHRQE